MRRRSVCSDLLCPKLLPVVGTPGELSQNQVQLERQPTIFQWAPCLPEQSQPVAAKVPHPVPRDSKGKRGRGPFRHDQRRPGKRSASPFSPVRPRLVRGNPEARHCSFWRTQHPLSWLTIWISCRGRLQDRDAARNRDAAPVSLIRLLCTVFPRRLFAGDDLLWITPAYRMMLIESRWTSRNILLSCRVWYILPQYQRAKQEVQE